MKPYPLRLPDPLREWLTEYAADQNRSVNEQIVYILREKQSREISKKYHPEGDPV